MEEKDRKLNIEELCLGLMTGDELEYKTILDILAYYLNNRDLINNSVLTFMLIVEEKYKDLLTPYLLLKFDVIKKLAILKNIDLMCNAEDSKIECCIENTEELKQEEKKCQERLDDLHLFKNADPKLEFEVDDNGDEFLTQELFDGLPESFKEPGASFKSEYRDDNRVKHLTTFKITDDYRAKVERRKEIHEPNLEDVFDGFLVDINKEENITENDLQ